VTIVLVIVLASLGGLALVLSARRRAQQRATQALLAKVKAAKKSRVPDVSNNVRGVTATQTMQPYRPAGRDSVDRERAA
jgi:CHASE1-domain containing sensor protein